eukprot:Protomagalhaensia_wolfi_Nauph_80__2620@NODE_2763_length_995_cov_20_905858_g2167_i0_p1_GENE_NODE_2763_length_995_cov_20_905858_g2167_i0NODE_2763_length_995_cov_20_905858_g2167_i0_p1_ORF_typecomplete_len217_score16_95_NODE_2763_length_995_cov_20_905858_g2167_i0209859
MGPAEEELAIFRQAQKDGTWQNFMQWREMSQTWWNSNPWADLRETILPEDAIRKYKVGSLNPRGSSSSSGSLERCRRREKRHNRRLGSEINFSSESSFSHLYSSASEDEKNPRFTRKSSRFPSQESRDPPEPTRMLPRPLRRQQMRYSDEEDSSYGSDRPFVSSPKGGERFVRKPSDPRLATRPYKEPQYHSLVALPPPTLHRTREEGCRLPATNA